MANLHRQIPDADLSGGTSHLGALFLPSAVRRAADGTAVGDADQKSEFASPGYAFAFHVHHDGAVFCGRGIHGG